MERLQQLQRDGTTMNAVGSERNNNNSSDDNAASPIRRKRSFRNVVLEAMKLHSFHNYIDPVLEPLIRRLVKEEIDVALKKVLASMNLNSANEASTSQSRSLQLQFQNKISLPVWTGRKIEGEGNTPIEVALVDTSTGKIVSSGPEAEAKVEIVVLEGDCGDEEFNSKIVREWEGKKSILRGNNYLKLKEGTGFVNEIAFAHNSEWMKNHKFRLGGTVRDAIFGTIIKDAKTEPFTVKDRRSTLKGKHHPPLASDEVWRLEKIHKHGPYHDRLRTAKINTVKDFLTLFSINPERLQKILRVGTDAKVWKVMVDHAQKCKVDEGVYLYHDPSYEQKTGVVFNAAGDLLGLVIESQYFRVNELPEGKKLDGQKSMISATEHWEEVEKVCFSDYTIPAPTNDHSQPRSSCHPRPADKISEIEKEDAQKLIITAFQHPEKVVPYEDMTSLINGFSCLTDDPLHQLNSPIVRSDSSTIIATNKKDSFGQPSGQPSDETIPSIYSMGATSSLDEFGLSGMESLRFDQPLTFQSQVSNSLICDTISLNQGFCEDDNPSQYFDNYTPSLVSEDSLPDSFLFPRTAYRRWRMLSNVIKMLLILRDGRNVISCANQE